MTQGVRVTTPSRLHFGLLRFRARSGPSYGGLGVMVGQPKFDITLTRSNHAAAAEPVAERVQQFADRALDAWADGASSGVRVSVEIRAVVPQHQGLGGGTQLALAVGAGVRCLLGLPPCSIDELAATMQRGRRSAVGSHGFSGGGLVWEAGRRETETLGRLVRRSPLPADWRFLLVCDKGIGLSGREERLAFDRLTSPSEETTNRLCQIAERSVLRGAERGDFRLFGEGIYEYGRIAGECFAAVQGGPYASEQIAARVCLLRRLGALGVGQSSWGPTVFATAESQDHAEELATKLRRELRDQAPIIQIASPDNRGATIDASNDRKESPSHQRSHRRAPAL